MNGVMDPHGMPSPGLAHLIATGREPGVEVRKRLGWPPICPTCRQKITTKRHRHVSLLLEEMVRNLRALEEQANQPAGPRVYGRGGKPAKMQSDRESARSDQSGA
jgi:hypothetical protein